MNNEQQMIEAVTNAIFAAGTQWGETDYEAMGKAAFDVMRPWLGPLSEDKAASIAAKGMMAADRIANAVMGRCGYSMPSGWKCKLQTPESYDDEDVLDDIRAIRKVIAMLEQHSVKAAETKEAKND